MFIFNIYKKSYIKIQFNSKKRVDGSWTTPLISSLTLVIQIYPKANFSMLQILFEGMWIVIVTTVTIFMLSHLGYLLVKFFQDLSKLLVTTSF